MIRLDGDFPIYEPFKLDDNSWFQKLTSSLPEVVRKNALYEVDELRDSGETIIITATRNFFDFKDGKVRYFLMDNLWTLTRSKYEYVINIKGDWVRGKAKVIARVGHLFMTIKKPYDYEIDPTKEIQIALLGH